MSSVQEKGHAKNVANFKLMNTCIAGYGAIYNPANSNILLAALNTKATNADAAVKAVQPEQTPYKDAKDARRVAYDKLTPLVHSAMNILKSSDGVSQTTINDAFTLAKKITGTNRPPKKNNGNTPATPAEAAEPTEQSHSVSQQSFDMRLANFNAFVSILQATPQYVPNEEDIQVAALASFAETLANTNTAVNEAFIPYNAALRARDIELYYPKTGLFDLAAKVKNYVSGLNGALGAAQKKQVTSLRFSKPADKALHF